jgi:hypothetical protein
MTDHRQGVPATPINHHEGLALLAETKLQLREDQRRRTANLVAELFRADQAQRQALKASKAAFQRAEDPSRVCNSVGPVERCPPSQESSSAVPLWARKRTKFYAVRRGRNVGIYHSWEECERQTKGVTSEFKSFNTYEEAKAYLSGRRLNFMAFRRAAKPASSFVWSKALRAHLDV